MGKNKDPTLICLKEILCVLEKMNIRIDRIPKVQANDLDIPPLWVRKAALGFDGFDSWDHAYKILCDYYNIPLLDARIEPEQVPKDASACYYSTSHKVCSKNKTVSHSTGIHEFFHHLFYIRNREYKKEPSEAMTRAYVKAFLEGVYSH